jgi:hypothetical protein
MSLICGLSFFSAAGRLRRIHVFSACISGMYFRPWTGEINVTTVTVKDNSQLTWPI